MRDLVPLYQAPKSFVLYCRVLSCPGLVKLGLNGLHDLWNSLTMPRTRQSPASNFNMASRPLESNVNLTNKDGPGVAENTENMSSHLNDDVHSLPAAQNRRILMKTDLVVLPCAVIAMTLAFLDKVSKKQTPLTFLNRQWPKQRAWRLGKYITD